VTATPAQSFRFRLLRPEEAVDAARRIQVSLGGAEDLEVIVERTRERVEEGLMWVLSDCQTDAVLGQTALEAGEHFFGGRRVACQHVVDVLVPPEYRGSGIASALMQEAIRHGAREGLGLSLLFPSTATLYQSLGWEHAGTFTRWRISTRLIPSTKVRMQPLDEEWKAIEDCQARWAACFNGPEVRAPRGWDRLRRTSLFAYGLHTPDGLRLEAYVLAKQKPIADHFQHTLIYVDWAALNPRGLRAVVGFSGRGTMAHDLVFTGPTPNPWGVLLPERDLERIYDFEWMARPLKLRSAVMARGYSEQVATNVTFTVNDSVMESNRGPWRLIVKDGRATLEASTEAEVHMEVTAVGPLFTGYRSASELERSGRLAGPSEAVARLQAMFAGPLPTLFDFF
jgi:predicted acetyltransferase